MDCIAGVYDKFYGHNTTEQTRLGKLRTKSLRTIQPDFFILNKNRRVLGTQSS